MISDKHAPQLTKTQMKEIKAALSLRSGNPGTCLSQSKEIAFTFPKFISLS